MNTVNKFSELDREAGEVCVDIFNDYAEYEVLRQPPSIQLAWEIGRKLMDLHKKVSEEIKEYIKK